MKPIKILSLAMIVGGLLLGEAAAQDAGAEWKALKEGQFKVHFFAPELIDGIRNFYKTKTAAHHTRYIAYFQGPEQEPAQAFIHIFELQRGYNFEREMDIERAVRDSFKDKKLVFGDTKKVENHIGWADTELFTVVSRECVAFRQYYGEAWTDSGMAIGTNALFGYYCLAPGEALTAAQIVLAVGGLRLKK